LLLIILKKRNKSFIYLLFNQIYQFKELKYCIIL
jgi:hypothetical protein